MLKKASGYFPFVFISIFSKMLDMLPKQIKISDFANILVSTVTVFDL